MDVVQKYENLKKIIGGLQRVVVAFSGGVDSSLLLKTSIDVLGKENVVAFIGRFPAFPEKEIDYAVKIAEELDCIYRVVDTQQLEDRDFLKNDELRCYFCKRHMMKKVKDFAASINIENVMEGSNIDDVRDYRPGRNACIELGVLSPLIEAELNKNEIREISRLLGLSNYKKPSFSCLATRIPYGVSINKEFLKMVELSEDYIKSLGVEDVRVRYHGEIARIEVNEDEMFNILSHRDDIVAALTDFGFKYVTLNLQGYKKILYNA